MSSNALPRAILVCPVISLNCLDRSFDHVTNILIRECRRGRENTLIGSCYQSARHLGQRGKQQSQPLLILFRRPGPATDQSQEFSHDLLELVHVHGNAKTMLPTSTMPRTSQIKEPAPKTQAIVNVAVDIFPQTDTNERCRLENYALRRCSDSDWEWSNPTREV